MLYDWIHEIVCTFFIDVNILPENLKIFVYFFEFWGLLILFKWFLMPVRMLIEWASLLSRSILNKTEWRPEWRRKQKRSLRNSVDD